MTIETRCSHCDRPLRLKPELAGKRIKCPQCRGIVLVPEARPAAVTPPVAAASASPAPTANAAPVALPPPATKPAPSAPAPVEPPPSRPPLATPVPTAVARPKQWHVKTENGELLGPVERAELDRWKRTGRLTADCHVLVEGSDQWQWATDLYPDLEVASSPSPPETPALAPALAPARVPAAAPPAPAPMPTAPAIAAQAARDDRPAVPAAESTSDRRWVTTFLLAFFLGALGIHRFYLGRVGTGLLMLLTGGGLVVWQIADVVRIALDKLPDHLGRPLKK